MKFVRQLQEILPKGTSKYLEEDDTVEMFESKFNCPQCFGAIDGSHIPIIAPTDCPKDYYNRKGFHFILLQGIVNNSYCFTDILLIYLISWPIKPFSDNGKLSADQLMFNYCLSRARSVVENAFGRLKGRWRYLIKRNDMDLVNVINAIAACTVLHNMCEINKDIFAENCLPESITDLHNVGKIPLLVLVVLHQLNLFVEL